MKLHPARLAIVSALAALLTACGGGGGNPGECKGSDEVCERPPGTGSSEPPFTVSPSTPPGTATTTPIPITTPGFATNPSP